MTFINSYEDPAYAEAYAKIEFPGTYYLAYRDLPGIISSYVKAGKALDFGCGAGRSSRFLKKCGFHATGADISENMIRMAKENDPSGDYRLITDGDFSQFQTKSFDLVLAAFTFDNIPEKENKIRILHGLRHLLKDDGIIAVIVSRPEIYIHEWASFSTADFPENHYSKSGDKVKIIITDTGDTRPVEDIVWADADYREIFAKAGLRVLEIQTPLASADEPFEWISETEISPWAVYVLGKTD
ncbi:MAG: class I SAM-dependent methyltransferase [Desulfococcaceae bacterium]